LGANEAPALAAVSSSESEFEATGDSDTAVGDDVGEDDGVGVNKGSKTTWIVTADELSLPIRNASSLEPLVSLTGIDQAPDASAVA
jgi:hypothetical protein